MSQESISSIKIYNSHKKPSSLNKGKGNKLKANANKNPTPINNSYTTQKDYSILFISGILLIAGITVIIITIKSSIEKKDIKKLLPALFSIIPFAAIFILGYILHIYNEITVDYSVGNIIFKTVKLFPFFTINNTVQIKQIRHITVKNNFHIKTKTNCGTYYAFEIYITLKDGTKDKVCTGIDKDGEGRNVYTFLKINLPKNTSFSGNLTKKGKK